MDKKLSQIWKDYYKSLKQSLKDPSFQKGVKRGTTNYEIGIRKLLEKHPESRNIARVGRKIKEDAIDKNKELIELARETFEKKGARVLVAKDKEEALKYFEEIVGSGKVIVKGKSMTSEEIRLREFLLENNNEVWETDLGEFIVQLLYDRPMHIVTPALHVPRERVAKTFSKFFGRKFDPNDVEGMVFAARNFLRSKYYSADFGIIGGNVISAKDGAIVSIHNEGNIRFSTVMPKKVIVLTGIEKIVPTLDDALLIAQVTARFGKYKVAGYYDVWSSSKFFKEKDLTLILLDNGRSKMIADPIFKEATYCLRCGACMYVCPTFKAIAGKFGGSTYVGGIGAIWTWFIEGPERAIPALYSCAGDGRCEISCPLNINIPKMIELLREKYMSD